MRIPYRLGRPDLVQFDSDIPILRIFDVDKARAFYVDYLGMRVDFEHRFEPGLPLYMQVSRGNLVLHLSEHHGDGTPGSVVYVETSGVRDLHAELEARRYDSPRPGIETDEIGTSVTLIDPFGNTIRFNEPPT
jgi:ribosomal-protein-alanine N-acetyltransferase